MSAMFQSGAFPALIGTEEATIDDKGRVLIAKKKRERLGERFAMSLGDTGCVVVYPNQVWQSLLAEVLSVPATNPARQEYSRLVMATADDELNFDKQGRVVIPFRLRREASLTDNVMIVGVGDRLEIWSADEWAKYESDREGYRRDRRDAIESTRNRMTEKA